MGKIDVDRIVSKGSGIQKKGRYTNDRTIAEALILQNQALSDLEKVKYNEIDSTEQPLVIISYVPRSGSTLLSQLLSSSGSFNYISNFQARYWMAPFIGGKIEQSLNIRLNNISDFYSDYGRTRLPFDPSEFNYFWEHWFHFSDESNHVVNQKSIIDIDLIQLKKQILAIMTLENKPLFFKKEWLGMNAGILLSMFPKAKFIHVTRDIEDTIKSMLKARKDIYGDEIHWFAAKPENYQELLHLPPKEQISKQIEGINQLIFNYKKDYPNQFLLIPHEEILSKPKQVMVQISTYLDMKIEPANCPNSFLK